MSVRVAVKAQMLRWACERARLGVDELAARFPKLEAWIAGDAQPTLKQLEQFAKAVHVPIGFMFLPNPPNEPLPIPDFRTVSDQQFQRPSPDLLDTIYAMQQRQGWLSDTLLEDGMEPLAFVGSARLTDPPESIGAEMRRVVGVEDGWASKVGSWQEAVSELRRSIEQLGVIAVINGVVGNNTHRTLDVAEFRGFAISDSYAPLIFVNGADAKSAQMFTLVHELAHIWLGEGGLSGFEGLFPRGTDVEDWCNKAAAEFLVPASDLIARWPQVRRMDNPFKAIAREFKVSPIVAARRALDLRLIDRNAFFTFYGDYIQQEQHSRPRTGGGDFYNNQNTRVGKLLAGHVIRAAMEGRIGFREAYDLTGLRGGAFQEYSSRLGVDI